MCGELEYASHWDPTVRNYSWFQKCFVAFFPLCQHSSMSKYCQFQLFKETRSDLMKYIPTNPVSAYLCGDDSETSSGRSRVESLRDAARSTCVVPGAVCLSGFKTIKTAAGNAGQRLESTRHKRDQSQSLFPWNPMRVSWVKTFRQAQHIWTWLK